MNPFVVLRVTSWIVFVDPRPKIDPQNHTNGHEQEVKKRSEMRSEK